MGVYIQLSFGSSPFPRPSRPTSSPLVYAFLLSGVYVLCLFDSCALRPGNATATIYRPGRMKSRQHVRHELFQAETPDLLQMGRRRCRLSNLIEGEPRGVAGGLPIAKMLATIGRSMHVPSSVVFDFNVPELNGRLKAS